MRRPRVFIASSKESDLLVKVLKRELHADADVVAWNDTGVFRGGHVYLDDLIRLTKDFDFGLFLYEKDDQVISRGVKSLVPRDNVIFEHGLFMSQIGRGNAFAIAPRGGVKMLSDLAGVKPLEYDESEEIADLRESVSRKGLNLSSRRTLEQRLDSACTEALKGVLAEFRERLKEGVRDLSVTVAPGPEDVVGVSEPLQRLLRTAAAHGSPVTVKHLALDMEIAWRILVDRVFTGDDVLGLEWRCLMIDPDSPVLKASHSDSVSIVTARNRIAEMRPWCREHAEELTKRKIVFECRAYSTLPVMHGFLVKGAGLLWSLTDIKGGRLTAQRTRYWEFRDGKDNKHAIQSFDNWFEFLWSSATAICPDGK